MNGGTNHTMFAAPHKVEPGDVLSSSVFVILEPDPSEVLRIAHDGTVTYHWDRIKAEAERWVAGDSNWVRALCVALAPFAPKQTCACAVGMCRGGEVIDGRLPNGDLCKAAQPYKEAP